jgi:hypothetical protein
MSYVTQGRHDLVLYKSTYMPSLWEGGSLIQRKKETKRRERQVAPCLCLLRGQSSSCKSDTFEVVYSLMYSTYICLVLTLINMESANILQGDLAKLLISALSKEGGLTLHLFL